MSGEVLVRVPSATVYKVERTSHTVEVIVNGDFVVAYASPEDDAGLLAQVGRVSWPLGRWAATLQFDDYTYAFQLPQLPYDGPDCHYYCVTLQADTPSELIDLLQAVLASGSAYHDKTHLAALPGVSPPPPQHPGHPLAACGAAAAPTAAAAARQEGVLQGSNPADRIADSLQRGGQAAAAGVARVASWAGIKLQQGADAAVARMQSTERPKQLSPEALARLESAKVAAAKAADVSGRVVEAALSVTSKVAGALAGQILSTSAGRRFAEGTTGQDVRKVGFAGVEAMEAVYDSLADAARVVLAHTHAAATRAAGHKYGEGAAQATAASVEVIQSVVQTGLNVYKLRPTALAKKVIKGTAQGVVLGSHRDDHGSEGGSTAKGSNRLYPGGFRPAAPAAPTAAASAPGSFIAATAPAAPLAATSLLSALSAALPPPLPPPQPQPPQCHGAVAVAGVQAGFLKEGNLSANPGRVGPTSVVHDAGGVAEGVVVSGPVAASPVVANYTPAAAWGAAPFPPRGSGTTGQPLPYPAVSTTQYQARHYPPIPR